MTKSILDEVEGIGNVRKKKIWNHFKSLKRLKQASVEEIAAVVPMQVAQSVYNILHNTDQNENPA
ncbi:uvrABC system protein C [Amedibacillus dolichus CAG:375]|nr:uvrABC system protein C [Amedibacillus dolichus CAG:375]